PLRLVPSLRSSRQLSTPNRQPVFMPQLPLFIGDGSRPIAWRDGRVVSLGDFRRDVAAIAAALPRGESVVNLCDDRYYFLAAYAAALSAKRTSLLPPSRVEQVVC